MISKYSIFVSVISSSIFGGSDCTLAESTLSVFGCQWGSGGGCGSRGFDCGVCGGGDGDDGDGGHDDGGGGDGGG